MTKDIIFEKTIMLSQEHTLDKISMRMIAREVGCSPSTLYHHFTDKEDLYEQIFTSIIETMPCELPSNFEDAITALFIRSNQFRDKHNFLVAYKKVSCVTSEKRALQEEKRKEKMAHMAELVRRDCVDVDFNLLQIVFAGALNEMLKQDDITDEDIKKIVKLVCNGILKKENDE